MVEEMGVEDEEDKQMEQIQNFLVHFSEEVLEVVTVEEKKDKHQAKINLVPGSLGWKLFLVEGAITAVIVVEVDTTMDIIMVIIMDTTMGTTTMDLTMGITMDLDLTMGTATMVLTMETTMDLDLTMGTTMATTMATIMGITMDTITDTTMGTAMLEEASTLEEAVVDANVIITSHSKINMEKLMELARELTRQAGYGAILPGMDVVMLASHRDFLTILGLTKLVVARVGNKLLSSGKELL